MDKLLKEFEEYPCLVRAVNLIKHIQAFPFSTVGLNVNQQTLIEQAHNMIGGST